MCTCQSHESAAVCRSSIQHSAQTVLHIAAASLPVRSDLRCACKRHSRFSSRRQQIRPVHVGWYLPPPLVPSRKTRRRPSPTHWICIPTAITAQHTRSVLDAYLILHLEADTHRCQEHPRLQGYTLYTLPCHMPSCDKTTLLSPSSQPERIVYTV